MCFSVSCLLSRLWQLAIVQFVLLQFHNEPKIFLHYVRSLTLCFVLMLHCRTVCIVSCFTRSLSLSLSLALSLSRSLALSLSLFVSVSAALGEILSVCRQKSFSSPCKQKDLVKVLAVAVDDGICSFVLFMVHWWNFISLHSLSNCCLSWTGLYGTVQSRGTNSKNQVRMNMNAHLSHDKTKL